MNENPNTNLNQSIKVDLNATENIPCEGCEGVYYKQVFIIKRLSALVSPSGEERLIPIQTFQCSTCGHVNEKFGLEQK